MTPIPFEPKGNVDPVPYSIEEFAKETGIGRKAVIQRIASGDLKTVQVGVYQRIPVSELRRLLNEVVDHVEEVRMALAIALQDGLIKEVEVDEQGCVVYERTEVP